MEFDETPIEFDGELRLSRDGDDDWCSIEKAEHSGAFGFKPIGFGSFALTFAGRVSDADIEGTTEEMLGIAKAILGGRAKSHKRCAVSRPKAGRIELWSPRNSMRPASVPIDRAKALAGKIVEALS